jgi:hypothetical protein
LDITGFEKVTEKRVNLNQFRREERKEKRLAAISPPTR